MFHVWRIQAIYHVEVEKENPMQGQNIAIIEAPPKSEVPPKRRGRPTREDAEAKQTIAAQADFLAGCTLDERAYCVRLIRLLRANNYWMPELIRQILDKESSSRYDWTIEGVKKLLDNFDIIETLAENASKLGLNWSNHPILRAIRMTWKDEEIIDYTSNTKIRKLIESARPK
jgi:hypothetical protein